MTILIASGNPHKLDEIRAVFAREGGAGSPVELVGLTSLDHPIPEPVEDQDSFEGNALLKARYYAAVSGLVCLADDSGLVVDALGGAPGVLSARYAAAEGPRDEVDRANNARLIRELGARPIEERAARFVCVMALCEPGRDQPLAVVRGSVEGHILGPGERGHAADGPCGRGHNGFGYDPVFVIDELGFTAAEIAPEQKNAVSHRGRAARAMWEQIRGLGLR